ncbi:DUF4386 domain-containing protein [Longispora sp. NPDC051575]|uniref:DUF4386 domain-containing protein n=1 Tax=Longispora sp. NPDC051575 TaxID=3154943 RepID=UPI003412FB3C
MGALFLLAFVVYIAGNALVEGGSGGRLPAGALLMLANSVVVAGIGVLVFPVLRAHGEASAHGYLVARAGEALLLAVGVVLLLLQVPLAGERDGGAALLGSLAREGNRYAYQVAMISLGLGSLAFCRVLFRARLVPRPVALWGLAGYAVLTLGAVLEILGHRVGVALSVPGGLFEVALGVLLLVRGFPVERPAPAVPVGDLV